MKTTHEVTSHLKAAAKIQRLTLLYSLVNDIKMDVATCQNQGEVLARVFGRLGRCALFPVIFVAQRHDDARGLHLTHSHGIPLEQAPELELALADPAGVLRRAIDTLSERQTRRLDLASSGIGPTLAPLLCRLGGPSDLLLMPMHGEGRLSGVIGLGVCGPEIFDAEHLAILDHISTDVSAALGNIITGWRREAAEASARMSEQRFREVFESSPLPMQMYSTISHLMVSINPSMQKWLGYDLADVAEEEDWLKRFFANEGVRQTVRKLWKLDISTPAEGDVFTSPEMNLTAKDGSTRTATATLTRLGDEVLIAWNDLTEIRRKEKVSVESEALFRRMIEESAVGIYVRRAGHFIYANNRYCEIIGYPRDEVIGLDIHRVTTDDPENLDRIHAAWQKLENGAPSVTYRVPLIRKDGVIIELELHARRVDWDGLPADIVVVDDITERKQQEDKIAGYLKQLEGSMKSTLTAISHMVEMRDPYTAGHERRTGLIAAAIAREMGWPEERCATLEMIGLVHDIGKIAVPAEILTKPVQLTELEYRMVKEHAQAGYDILKDIPFPTPIARIIWQHHEHLDGSGYPNRLKGDEILPEARVLAVADLIESMSSHRPYRPALGVDAALEELKKNRGTMFDAAVVDAIARMIEEKGYKLPD